jgi:hypothetical protein
MNNQCAYSAPKTSLTYKTTINQDVGVYSKIIQYMAHESSICGNPRLHSYTADKKT